MKRNYYFLIVGILSILFSFTHAWNGYTKILPIIDGSNIDVTIKTSFLYIWHIISVENLIFGIAFIIMAFYKDQLSVIFPAIIITGIILARWVIIIISTIIKEPQNIGSSLIDSIAIFVYVGLILIGINRTKHKIT